MTDRLARYRSKRDFARTPEPKGRARQRRGKQLSFVVQQHAARRLHYDFRLELGGVLKSWAVPKGPSLDPRVKRLAVQVEDHPLDYADFEGVIPAGEYGGGTVLVWDRGEWIPLDDDPERALADGALKFELKGKKLRGRWALVQMRKRESGKNWLLIKERDGKEKPGSGDAIITERPESVASGRDLAAVAKARDRVWRSDRNEIKAFSKVISGELARRGAALPRCRRAVPRGAALRALPRSRSELAPGRARGAGAQALPPVARAAVSGAGSILRLRGGS